MVTALAGIRVADFSRGRPGTLAAMLLSDHGAEVIRVEPPGGDRERGSAAYPMWRRGQKSVVIDLRSADGRRRARALSGGMDVVIQNWRPGVAEQIGLDYESLAAGNPGLVYCGITGFGPRGKYARVKGYEGVVAARAGRYALREARLGLRGRAGPRFLASPHGSYGAAQSALQGILAALFVRERCGRGQRVDAALVRSLPVYDVWDGMMDWMADEYPDTYRIVPATSSSGVPLSPYFFTLLNAPAKDGKWFQFANVLPHMWKAFIAALGLEHTFQVPDFARSPNFESEDASYRFWQMLLERLQEKTADEWMEIFLPVDDIAADLLRETDDARNHPQMRINGHVVEIDDPKLGKMEQIGPQYILRGTPADIRAGAPEPGEHNALLDHLPEVRRAKLAAGGRPLPAHPLDGITVLELGTYFAAPFGVTLLAELGARVIKIEPIGGDPIRAAMPIPEAGGVNVLQGKESIALDLGSEEGREIVYAIARTADLVLCSFRQGVPERLKIDAASLRALNPNLIYHHGVAYGLEGLYPKHPVYGPTPPGIVGETLYQMGAGVMPAPGDAIDNETVRDVALRLRQMNAGLGDPIAALGVCSAMLMGLVARERTGIAQESMTTMICSAGYMMSDDFVWYEGKPPRALPDPELYGIGALYRMYRCADGWLFVAATTEKEWRALCGAVHPAAPGGTVDLRTDPRFATGAGRRQNEAALAQALGAAFLSATAAEWEARLHDADVAAAIVNETPLSRFALRDPIMHENGFVEHTDHFSLGPHLRHGITVGFSEMSGAIKPCPAAGQHTEAVLRELGRSDDEILALEQRGIIARW